MTAEYIRYTTAPALHISYNCGGMSCGIDTVHHDGDDFICNDCGTTWHDDGDEGTLYPEWSGEDLTGPTVDPDHWEPRRRLSHTPPAATGTTTEGTR